MPITVRHGAVGALGQLAVQAGQARGQEIRLGRGIQLSNMIFASGERGADVAANRAEKEADRAFALQRAGAAQIARQSNEPDATLHRQKLRQTVDEAKASGIFDPRQIKQMQIFADLGDDQAIRSLLAQPPTQTQAARATSAAKQAEAERLGLQKAVSDAAKQAEAERLGLQKAVSDAEQTGAFSPAAIAQARIFANLGDPVGLRGVLGNKVDLPGPSVRLRELQRQSKVVSDIGTDDIAALQEQITEVGEQIAQQSFLLLLAQLEQTGQGGANREAIEALRKHRDILVGQVSAVRGQVRETQKQIALGFTVAQQEDRAAMRESREQKAKAAAVQQVEKRNQRRIEREIASQERRLRVDPYGDTAGEKARVDKASERIRELEKDLDASFDREDAALTGRVAGSRRLPSEENAIIDALLLETGGDVDAAKRLAEQRGER